MTIGENIYNLRTSKGLTQQKLAEMSGVSQAAINLWENGKRQPRLEQLQRISEALGVTRAYFINFDEFVQLNEIENDEEELLDDYRKLNTNGQAEARKRIQELTEIKRYTDKQ